MNSKLSKKIGALIAAFGMVLWMICGVFMFTSADEAKGFRLICKTPDGILRENNHWDMYLIGGTDSNGERFLTGDFADFPIDLDLTSTSTLTDTARTLESYARTQKITPTASGNSDANGILAFDDLENGLYLFVGKYIKDGAKTYIPVSFIAEITDASTVIDVSPKYTSQIVMAGEDYGYTVKKIWKNGGNRIPDSILADIYCDGELYETVQLDDSNDWTYDWTADEFYIWDVIERDVPDGFKVVYRSNEWQYVIVNTLSTQKPGIDVVTTTSTATTTSTNTTTTSATSESTETVSGSASTSSSKIQSADATTVKNISTPEAEKLPQTGQLWWPVPVLIALGLILMAIGIRMRPKE